MILHKYKDDRLLKGLNAVLEYSGFTVLEVWQCHELRLYVRPSISLQSTPLASSWLGLAHMKTGCHNSPSSLNSLTPFMWVQM